MSRTLETKDNNPDIAPHVSVARNVVPSECGRPTMKANQTRPTIVTNKPHDRFFAPPPPAELFANSLNMKSFSAEKNKQQNAYVMAMPCPFS